MLALTLVSPPERFDLLVLLQILLIIYPYIAVPMLLVAGPLYLVLRHYDMVNLLTILTGGILTGFLMALILPHAPGSNLHAYWTMMVAGAAAALVFWLIWRLRKVSGTTIL